MKFRNIGDLPFDAFTLISASAYKTPGREACGVLVGSIVNDTALVYQARPIKNISENDDSFVMDPTEYLAAIMDTDFYSDTPKYTLLGIYHTHPDFPGYPSLIDWNAAESGNVIRGMYLIFTTHGNSLHSYYWDGDKFIVLKRTQYGSSAS